jgi:hypothetical protein
MRIFVAALGTVLIGLFSSGSVNAQYDPVSVGNWQLSSNITYVGGLVLQGQQSEHDTAVENQNRTPQANANNNQKRSNIVSATLTYTPTKSRTRDNLRAVGRRLAKSNPTNAVQAEQLFANNDIIGAVGGALDQLGLQRNNVAHAYAMYWVVYWGLANKVYDTPSRAAMQSVAKQVEQSLVANPSFVALNNDQKQAAAEELMALTAIMDASSEQAKSDPAFAVQIAKASLEGSRKSGLDLDAMTLTEDGFVPVKKARKTGDASSAGAERAMAAADPADDGGDTSPNYVLFAALGSATLGGMYLVGKAVGRKG